MNANKQMSVENMKQTLEEYWEKVSLHWLYVFQQQECWQNLSPLEQELAEHEFLVLLKKITDPNFYFSAVHKHLEVTVSELHLEIMNYQPELEERPKNQMLH